MVMSGDEFWQRVYLACIKAGKTTAWAKSIADEAKAAWINLR